MSDNLNIDKIKDAISKIKDPDLGLTLEELDAVKEIKENGDALQIQLELVQPIHWAAEKINVGISEELKKAAPGAEFEVLVNEKPFELGERKYLKGVKNIIAVASGKGGVGKSALAANIAASLSLKEAKVGLLDGDVYGPSQPTMYGLKDDKLIAEEREDGSTVAYPIEKYGVKVASMGFVMEQNQAAIVRGPLLSKYFSVLFEQVDWGALDFLVFDLPPGTGDIQLTLTQQIPLTGSVIVTTPQDISLADVRRAAAMFRKVDVVNLGVIENMSYFTPPELPDKKYYIFGKGGGQAVAKEQNVGFLGEAPLDMQMRETNDGGTPLVFADRDCKQTRILNEVTANIVSEVRKQNHKKSKQSNVDISV